MNARLTSRRAACPTPVRPGRVSQRGSVMLESLIGMLIFVIGMLGMIAAQSAGSRVVIDAQFRTEAAAAADDLIGLIKTAPPADRVTEFATGGGGFTSWLNDRVIKGGRGLPGADATVDFGAIGGDARTVRIVVSWAPPREKARSSSGLALAENVTHQHVTVSAIYE